MKKILVDVRNSYSALNVFYFLVWVYSEACDRHIGKNKKFVANIILKKHYFH